MILRKMSLADDMVSISEMIYDTDPWIYPTFLGNVDYAKKVMPLFIKANTIYNYNNIYVADDDGIIKGIVIIMEKFPVDNYYVMKKIISDNKLDLPKFEWLNKDYFETLNFDFKGIYITNVCVKKEYRGKGIASFMLANLPNKTYSLAVVKENLIATKLYLDSGFEKLYEYPGFMEVPCIEMVRWEK